MIVVDMGWYCIVLGRYLRYLMILLCLRICREVRTEARSHGR